MQKRILKACLLPVGAILASCVPMGGAVAPVLSEVEPIATTASPTPTYRFGSSFGGTISYGGDCSSATTSAHVDINEIKLNFLAEGLHSNCTITVTTASGVASAPLTISPFTIDNPNFNVTQVTPISSPTADNTPSYVFSTTQAGTITYGGSCSSSLTTAALGSNTVTFNTLPDATYTNCVIVVYGTASSSYVGLAVPAFIVDATKPVLAQVTAVPVAGFDTTPDYTFSSSEAGIITYTGDCSSATSTAVKGNNTVTFNALSYATHSNCTITVKDAVNNISTVLAVSSFAVVRANPLNDTGYAACGDYPTTTASYLNSVGTLTSSPNNPGSGYVNATYTNVPLTTLSGTGSGAKATVVVATANGVITALGTITAGTGYTNGTYNNVALTNVTGTGTTARANITVSGGVVTAVTLVFGGSGYAAANNLSAAASTIGGTGSGFVIPVSTITSQSRVSSITITTPGSGYAVNDNVSAANTSLGGAGSGLTVNVATLGASNNGLVCSTVGATQTTAGTDSDGDAVPKGQDGVFGRDVNNASNGSSDGLLGFSFTKLDINGTPLATQNGTYTAADAGTESAGTKWTCVKDNVTGLIWEIKTDLASPDLRDKDNKYTWYNSNTTTNGGAVGTADTGSGVGSDACFNNARCDTEKYIADVNAANICGEATDNWRLPTVGELDSIRNLSRVNPAVETSYFVKTLNANYWASSPDSASTANAWTVSGSTGAAAVVAKSSTATYVRLVRSSN